MRWHMQCQDICNIVAYIYAYRMQNRPILRKQTLSSFYGVTKCLTVDVTRTAIRLSKPKIVMANIPLSLSFPLQLSCDIFCMPLPLPI